jgi:hypothetical protein
MKNSKIQRREGEGDNFDYYSTEGRSEWQPFTKDLDAELINCIPAFRKSGHIHPIYPSLVRGISP